MGTLENFRERVACRKISSDATTKERLAFAIECTEAIFECGYKGKRERKYLQECRISLNGGFFSMDSMLGGLEITISWIPVVKMCGLIFGEEGGEYGFIADDTRRYCYVD